MPSSPGHGEHGSLALFSASGLRNGQSRAMGRGRGGEMEVQVAHGIVVRCLLTGNRKEDSLALRATKVRRGSGFRCPWFLGVRMGFCRSSLQLHLLVLHCLCLAPC